MFGSHLTPRSYEMTRSASAVMHPVCPLTTRRLGVPHNDAQIVCEFVDRPANIRRLVLTVASLHREPYS